MKLELTKNKTPYDAQLMLAGAGGVGTVPLNRDDGTQLELEIFYGDEVAGGHSRYEVVNQITFTDLATSLSSKRRIDIMLLAQGIFRYNISKTKMMDIKVPVPSIEEQEVVGRFFSNIDNLIAANQRKLDLLKEQKKGFLQNMFV
ncbi:hypothetical protein AO080_12050 (plasmid) [Weissella cibaria]|nr:restriction endonuclease subunit S [Weissella cibaria]ALI34161.1 hypothetical protein AO080_11995 [Weissella cibaria]ALI34171.1 hypothetical protein AO080_12050 [Weissella cibaria]